MIDVTSLVHKVTQRSPSEKTSMRREIHRMMESNKGPLTREEVYTLDKLLALAKVKLIEKA